MNLGLNVPHVDFATPGRCARRATMVACLIGLLTAAVTSRLAADESANDGSNKVSRAEWLAAATQVAAATMDAVREHPEESRFEALLTVAAINALRCEPQLQSRTFLLAIALAGDDSGNVRRMLESRGGDPIVLPTEPLPPLQLMGRHDLALHFLVSCALTAEFGEIAARAAGLAKELADRESSSGFSFVDLAIDHAGVRFAAAVLSDQVRLESIQTDFEIADFVPPIDGLPEGLNREALEARHEADGLTLSARMMREVDRRVRSLAGYSAPEDR